MNTTAKIGVIALTALAIASCASMRQKVEKAPCGPTASVSEPCGDRTPINVDWDGTLLGDA